MVPGVGCAMPCFMLLFVVGCAVQYCAVLCGVVYPPLNCGVACCVLLLCNAGFCRVPPCGMLLCVAVVLRGASQCVALCWVMSWWWYMVASGCSWWCCLRCV